MLGHIIGNVVEIGINCLFHKLTKPSFARTIGVTISYLTHEVIVEPLVDAFTWRTISGINFNLNPPGPASLASSALGNLLLTKLIETSTTNFMVSALISYGGTHIGEEVYENGQDFYNIYSALTSINYDAQ